MMVPTPEEQQIDIDKVEEAIKLLMEHFEAVQIFATRMAHPKCTIDIRKGSGNFYARYGLTKLWVDEQMLDVVKINTEYDGEN